MDALAERLVAAVGREHVLVDPDLRAGYETDWTRRYRGEARLVVRPGNTDDVMAVVRLCADARAAVVPQGGNTGLVGGGVPRGGEVVVSLSRLDHLEPVDAVAGDVVCGAGVTLSRLQEHIRAAGFDFGVDLASRDSATLGGMIATNAGGIRVLRYGGMRRQLLGVEAVLADGSRVRRMPGLAKDNTGYDIPGLIAGSEGTLAVVTRAHVRLIPRLTFRAVALLAVENISAVLAVLEQVRGLPSLEAAEVFFRAGVERVTLHTRLPPPFGRAYETYLLLECAGLADPLPDLARALDGADVLDTAIATDRAGREALWAYRERHTEALSAAAIPHKLDIALSLRQVERFVTDVERRVSSAVPAAQVVLFGHIADGNVHVNVLGPAPDDDRATDAVLRFVAELGGSISAEHGIGTAKRRWLHLTRSAEEIAIMAAIKRALDPQTVLNPGVIFGSVPAASRSEFQS